MSGSFETRPAASVAAVTKSDTTDIAKLGNEYPRALFIGVGGDVVVVAPDGTSATFKNVPSGSVLPVKCRRVNAATTATDIVALY